jgi:glycosyltransferase involved in cell wall biosynthesis
MRDEPARAPLWIVDWSDSEDADFEAACAKAGVQARVVRGVALGSTVGRRFHRARSWPTYAWLAASGLREARGAPLVAWQPLAGGLAGLLRRGGRPPLVILNPLLDPTSRGLPQRVLVAGARRADRVVFFSSPAVDAAVEMGLDRSRLRFVRLGVAARPEWQPPAGGFLLAIGREARDWTTLARAAEGLDGEIRVVGPQSLPGTSRLTLVPQRSREDLAALIAESRAVVVPLLAGRRTAGQLTVLDAMAVGRAVVATSTQGTVDYVTAETGVLVPPGDPEPLRAALLRVLDDDVVHAMGRAAFDAAQGPFSLERFVASIDDVCRSI